MTAQRPKEYIITEFQLKQLQGYADLDFVCQAIRSRPHTSTPALFQIESNSHEYTIGQILEISENIQKQRKEAARQARDGLENALKDGIGCMREMKDWTQCHNCPYHKVKDNGHFDCLIDMALQCQQQAGEQG